MKNNVHNIYVPMEAAVQDVMALSEDVGLFTFKTRERLRHRPGQFYMVSVMGYGEVPISVASPENERFQLCIRRVGHVTSALHGLRPGDKVGLRGPYGNGFPLEPAKGRDVLVVAGGLGIVPLRPLLLKLLKEKEDYGRLFLFHGARNPADILFRDESAHWERSGVTITHTVDCADANWKGCVGVVTAHLDKVQTDLAEATAYVCGPPVMIDAAMRALANRAMPEERIITSLEAHMKCGVGKCGHCYRGAKYLCTDGPVFSLRELKTMGLP
jgi:sulfhydrogenase subunit gamma (sulfur reductase)